MRKIINWIKRIFIITLSLLVVLIIGLWISFSFWKKDAISNLPKAQLMNTENGQIEYAVDGASDKYVLMIHGMPGSVHVSKERQFLKQGYTTLGLSRPGYYLTPLSSGKTPKEQAALYKSLIDKLNIDSVYVFGASGGGPSSIQFALDYPERCAGLILFAAVSEKWEPQGELMMSDFGTWLFFQVISLTFDKEMKKEMNWLFTNSFFPIKSIIDGYDNDSFQFANLDNFPFEEIVVPTLLIHGTNDINVPFSFSQQAAKRIPNATLFEMKGKDHYAIMTSYRDTIYQQVFNFLQNLELESN
tara:strand:- start:21 stop:923 length:903 start_codon:yes stop_codon:yes gene_type:complete